MASIAEYDVDRTVRVLNWRKANRGLTFSERALLGMLTGEVSDPACPRDDTGQGESKVTYVDDFATRHVVSTARSRLGANVHFKVKNQPIYPFKPHNTCTSWSSRVVSCLEGLL